MTGGALLVALDPVAVQTQELNIVALSCDDALVEGDPVLSKSLLRPAAEDVIDIKDTFVGDATPSTRPSEVLDSRVSGRAISVVPTGSCQFLDAIRVVPAPRVNLVLLGKVVAARTDSSLLHGGLVTALRAEFRLGHEENHTGSGKRVEKML